MESYVRPNVTAMSKRIDMMNEFQKEVLAYLNDIDDRLIRLERMIAGSQRFAHAVATSEYRRDLNTMANFDALNSRVTKISDIATAIKTMYDGVVAERDAAKAELATLQAADQLDQGAVDAAEANLATAEAVLAALTAVTDNTGGSTGGVGGSTGGV